MPFKSTAEYEQWKADVDAGLREAVRRGTADAHLAAFRVRPTQLVQQGDELVRVDRDGNVVERFKKLPPIVLP